MYHNNFGGEKVKKKKKRKEKPIERASVCLALRSWVLHATSSLCTRPLDGITVNAQFVSSDGFVDIPQIAP